MSHFRFRSRPFDHSTLMWWTILILIVLLSVLAPFLTSIDPLYASGQGLRPPSAAHWLGTDLIGRDIFSRLLYGGQSSLLNAAAATLIAIFPGTVIGMFVGFAGGWLDALFGLLLDAMLAFPSLLMALALITIIGTGTLPIVLAAGLAGFPPFSRVARAAVRQIRTVGYIESARSIGSTERHILWVHVLPNVTPILLSFGGVIFSWALLNESALAFLGFAGNLSTPDWGIMLAAGRQTMLSAPLAAIAPGLLITLTILAVNRLVDRITVQ